MFIVPKILYIKRSCVDIIGNYHQIEGKEGTSNAAYTKGSTDRQIIFVVCNVSNNTWEAVFDKKP